MAIRSKAYVYSRLIAGIAGSNLAEGMDFFLFICSCCVGSGLCGNCIKEETGYNSWEIPSVTCVVECGTHYGFFVMPVNN